MGSVRRVPGTPSAIPHSCVRARSMRSSSVIQNGRGKPASCMTGSHRDDRNEWSVRADPRLVVSPLFLAFNISLALTVFSFGLHAQGFEDVPFMLRNPPPLLLSLMAMYIVTPVLALAITEYFDMPNTAKLALVSVSFSMIPPLLPQKEIASGGHGSYGIGLVIFVALLAPIGIPALINFLGRVTDRPYEVASTDIGGIVFGLVVVPLVLGVLVGWRWPGVVKPIQKYVPRTASYITLIALVVLLIAVFPEVWDYITGQGGGWVVLAAILFNLGALAIGHLMGGPDRDHSTVLAVSCACRHPAIAFLIARTNFPDKNV